MKTTFTLIITLLTLSLFSQTNRWDTIFNANNSVNNKILASTSNGNQIFVGGVFTNTAGQTTNYIASWNGTTWNIINNDLNGSVYAMGIWDNKLVVGGEFTMAGATTLNHIGVYDGTNWASLGTGTDGNVYAINVHDQYLYIGGSFTTIDGNLTNNIAQYTTSGGWVEYTTGPDDAVYAINTSNGIFAGGAFTTSNGTSTPYIAHYDGTLWNALSTSVNDTVRALEYNENVLFVGGDFTQAGTINETGCAIWDGSVWKTAGQGFNNDIYALKVYDGILYAGGAFTIASTKPAYRIAHWNGILWNGMGGGLDSSAYTISGMNRDVYIGGIFQNAEIFESKFFARWGAFPLITSEPTNQEICEGENLSFGLTSESSVPQTYQWYLNGTAIADSTNNTLNFTSITPDWSGIYYCKVTNQFGFAQTTNFTVTVNEHITINSQIPDTSSCIGTHVGLYISASGTNNTYHWYHNDTLINWAVDSTLHLYSLTYADTGIYKCVVKNFCDSVVSNNIHLSLNPTPSVSFTGLNSEYCSNDNADTLSGIPTGGNFTGNGISGNAFNPYSLSGTQTISYYYTDTNGCSNTSVQATNVKYVTPVSFTGLQTAYCIAADADTLTPTPTGGTFTGDGITDSIFTPQTAGIGSHTISYEMVQATGCTATFSQDVIVQSPNISIGTDTSICMYDTLTLTIVGDTGNYLWNTGETTQSINVSPNANTTYTAYITTLGGCNDTAEVTISVKNLPNVVFDTIQDFYCVYSEQDTLQATPTGGSFSGAGVVGNVFFPQSSGEGVHQIVYYYTDTNMCTNSDTVFANVQTASANGNASFVGLQNQYCYTADNDTLIGIPSGGVFVGEGITNNIFAPSQTSGEGIYYITYIVGTDSTCGSSYSKPVQILPFPELFVSNDTAVCNQQTVTIGAWGEPGTYLWNTGDTTNQIDYYATAERALSVILTAENGCTNTDTVLITMRDPILLGLEGDTSFCRGVTFTAPNGFTYYKWDYNDNEGQDITLTQTGNYKINVIDSFGCSSYDTLYAVVKPSPIVEFDDMYTIYADQNIILGVSGNYDIYYWNDGDDNYQRNFSGSDLGFGEHQISLFASYNGCTDSDTTIINVLDAINVNEINNSISFNIYPNPANSIVNIETNNITKIEIIDAKGTVIYTSSLIKGNNTVDIKNFDEGVYFVKLIFSDRVAIKQLIIER